MSFSFHVYNKFAVDGATLALSRLLTNFYNQKHENEGKTGGAAPDFSAPPVIVCVGSDLVIGDSLGPITGTLLKQKTQGLNYFLYGTLSSTVTAKEIPYICKFLKETHKNSPIIAIDAAVGHESDIGLIRFVDEPLRPGAGANKNLNEIGDISVLGIVAEKSVSNYGLLNSTRLRLVYSMAEIISDGLANFLWSKLGKKAQNA